MAKLVTDWILQVRPYSCLGPASVRVPSCQTLSQAPSRRQWFNALPALTYWLQSAKVFHYSGPWMSTLSGIDLDAALLLLGRICKAVSFTSLMGSFLWHLLGPRHLSFQRDGKASECHRHLLITLCFPDLQEKPRFAFSFARLESGTQAFASASSLYHRTWRGWPMSQGDLKVSPTDCRWQDDLHFMRMLVAFH